MAGELRRWKLGSRIAPPRFILFLVLAVAGAAVAVPAFGWRIGSMAAFDGAAAVFLASIYPLLGAEAERMRDAASRNDANRVLLLAITAIVMLAILVAIASELAQKGSPEPPVIGLIVATLALAWIFSNIVYTLHYAHIYYTDADNDGRDDGGLDFPKTDEPDYWDFIYFAFCLGMTFQVSDVDITSRTLRKVVTAHCLAAFVFNLGVLAFTINVLGGG